MSEQNEKRTREAEVADAAVSLGRTMASERGWLVAVVAIVIVIESVAYFKHETRSKGTFAHFAKIEEHRAEEFRRSQETISRLAEALSRCSVSAIEPSLPYQSN